VSGADRAGHDQLVVDAVEVADESVHRGVSMILVPMGTPGMDLIRAVGVGSDEAIGEGSHGHVQSTECRVPVDNLLLADQQSVRHAFADSWIQLEQFRLQVLYTAWQCDQHGYDQAREYIAGITVATPKTMMDIAYRSLHLHGSLGASNEMPFHPMLLTGISLGLADGPTEVHKDNLARKVLKSYRPAAPGLFPTTHLPARIDAAHAKFAAYLEQQVANS